MGDKDFVIPDEPTNGVFSLTIGACTGVTLSVSHQADISLRVDADNGVSLAVNDSRCEDEHDCNIDDATTDAGCRSRLTRAAF
jgi:hypothetical protein